SDGTTITRTWDETADYQREPQNTGLDDMADMQYGWMNAMALSPSGSVWTWDKSNEPVEVITGRNPLPAEGVTILDETMVLEKDGRAVVPVRPIPLLADYSALHYISSDATVARVSDRGVITAQADGKATITVTMTDTQGREYETQMKVLVGSASAIGDVLPEDSWRLQVAAKHHVLHVIGVPADMLVSVYNVSGTRVHQQHMAGTQIDIPVTHDGVYLVRAGRQVRKVMVHSGK
ncbi:MAG: Ig-like domain-containing protein, partial [Prevotella sp.]|nr:Ig-like domain-containing protein [Prevotella sp.]